VSEGAEVDVLFVDRWAKRAGALRGILDIDAVMLHTPSASRLLGHSLTQFRAIDIVRDIKSHTMIHQSLRYHGRQVSKLVSEKGYQLIHAQGVATSALLAEASGFRPYSVSAWGSDIYVAPDKFPYLRPLIARSLRDASFIHAESAISKDRIIELASQTEKRFVVSTWGADTKYYCPGQRFEHTRNVLSIPSGRILLSIRALEPNYRVDSILKAFAFVSKEIQDAVLVVASDGSQSEDLARLAENLGIADRTVFTGYIEDDDKRALMANSYLYVQFPVSDGVALSMMEAMSSGLPLVSSNVGETPVLVKNERNGLLAEGSTPKSLAEALLRLLKDTELRNDMGRESREMAMKDHDRSQFFRKFMSTVQEVVDASS